MRRALILLVVPLALAACGGETEPATNVGSTTATGNAIAGCKADLSGSYVWQTKAASGNWTDQGGPVAFDCPPDQDPNTAGYQWGRSDVPITQQFTGLTPSTTYQFRLEATLENGSKIHNDSVGATNGENYDSFTTTAPAVCRGSGCLVGPSPTPYFFPHFFCSLWGDDAEVFGVANVVQIL